MRNKVEVAFCCPIYKQGRFHRYSIVPCMKKENQNTIRSSKCNGRFCKKYSLCCDSWGSSQLTLGTNEGPFVPIVEVLLKTFVLSVNIIIALSVHGTYLSYILLAVILSLK